MKRRDLVARIEQAGCALLRHGAKHDIYHNPQSGRSEPVPRHREINELLAKKIFEIPGASGESRKKGLASRYSHALRFARGSAQTSEPKTRLPG